MVKRFLSEFRIYLCNRWVSCIPSHRVRLFLYRDMMKFQLASRCAIFMDCTFDGAGNFSLGKNSVINGKCRLDNKGAITIGDNVSISQEVMILTADHDTDSSDFAGRNRAVVINDYAWVGSRATIMPGVIIGKGAVVAAGALVTKNVEPYSVVAGIPARKIRERNTDLHYQLDYRRLFQ